MPLKLKSSAPYYYILFAVSFYVFVKISTGVSLKKIFMLILFEINAMFGEDCLSIKYIIPPVTSMFLFQATSCQHSGFKEKWMGGGGLQGLIV